MDKVWNIPDPSDPEFQPRCEALITDIDDMKAKSLYYTTFVANSDPSYVNKDIRWGQFKRTLEKYESMLKDTTSISEALEQIRKNMNEPVEREIALKIFMSSIRKGFSSADYFPILPKPKEITTFADVNPLVSQAPYIQQAYNLCLIHGRHTKNGVPINQTTGKLDPQAPRLFEPRSNITIAETVKVIVNMTRHIGEVEEVIGK